ncbi:MAG TPA: hypothetical protein V6C81_12230 [Planktothrix sp.]|jgi:ABC-type polysaccharide/polyol phosphate export permease
MLIVLLPWLLGFIGAFVGGLFAGRRAAQKLISSKPVANLGAAPIWHTILAIGAAVVAAVLMLCSLATGFTDGTVNTGAMGLYWLLGALFALGSGFILANITVLSRAQTQQPPK